ncbi:MAG: hypothetical protein FJY77_06385, partial [Candidatus Altiarchaeales archaeon]|nr:hypothetical protein [Candidatus Altiarchaeales archaeon]
MVKIRLIFRGGVQEVGRSSIELESNNVVMVFDFGVQVSEPPQYLNMPDYADSLVLSHAHLDHSGMAPALYERQSLPIYCTKPTSQLCQILQEDNLKVTERRGYALPYSKKDI